MIWEAYRDQRFSFQRDEERRKVSWPSVETTCIEEPDHEKEDGERDETSVLVFFSRIHEQEQEHEEEHEKEATERK